MMEGTFVKGTNPPLMPNGASSNRLIASPKAQSGGGRREDDYGLNL